jgi:hypothetical protein
MATYQKIPSSEFGSYSWLRREVGGYLGWWYNPSSYSPEQSDKIDSIIQSGLMQFYYPPPMKDDEGNSRPHKWTFLSPINEMTIEDGVREYALPEDYSGMIEGFTVGE